MQIICWGVYALAALLWADLSRWRTYYPTFLFMLASNFFAAVLMCQHTLWVYNPSFLLPCHTLTELFIAFIAYPGTILLFLSCYPEKGWLHQVGWVLFWVAAYTLSEFIPQSYGLIGYRYGWSLGWSVFHNLIMFPTLRIHHTKPGWAWLIAILYTIFVWIYFGFNIEDLK